MNASKKDTGTDFVKADAYVNTASDYDEIPELSDDDLARAVLRDNGKLIGSKSSFGEHAKTSVTVDLDEDVVAYYRRFGVGWQSKMNAALRKTIN